MEAQKLAQDVCDYLAYLQRKCGYSITLHGIERLCNECWPMLLSYNYHECAVCREIKSSPQAWQHCADRQDRIVERVRSGPFCGTCYAGVSEYVFPLQDVLGKVQGFLCVSGYVLDPTGSAERAQAAAQRYGLSKERMTNAVRSLQPTLPDLATLQVQIMPVQRMLSMLFYFNSLDAVQSEAATGSKRLYLEMVQYTNGRFRDPEFSLKEVCTRFSVSYSYASHLFAQYNGLSFARYVRKLRIEVAKRYLQHTTLSILFLSSECGFSDSNYFSSTFKAETGLSPSDYRAQFMRRNEP